MWSELCSVSYINGCHRSTFRCHMTSRYKTITDVYNVQSYIYLAGRDFKISTTGWNKIGNEVPRNPTRIRALFYRRVFFLVQSNSKYFPVICVYMTPTRPFMFDTNERYLKNNIHNWNYPLEMTQAKVIAWGISWFFNFRLFIAKCIARKTIKLV